MSLFYDLIIAENYPAVNHAFNRCNQFLNSKKKEMDRRPWTRKTVAKLGAEPNYSLDHIYGGETMERSTMSVVELSIRMGICLAKAYELVKQPDFPKIYVGTRILIPMDGFNKWLEQHSQAK